MPDHPSTGGNRATECAAAARSVRTEPRIRSEPAHRRVGVDTAYERLARPLGILDGGTPNLARFTFTDPRARTVYPDWGLIADEQVANLRTSTWSEDPAIGTLFDELTDSGSEFTDRWDARQVNRKDSGSKRLVHPDVGDLRVAFETMQLSDADDQRLVVYLPADDATAAALDHLAGRYPGALRSVAQTAS